MDILKNVERIEEITKFILSDEVQVSDFLKGQYKIIVIRRVWRLPVLEISP